MVDKPTAAKPPWQGDAVYAIRWRDVTIFVVYDRDGTLDGFDAVRPTKHNRTHGSTCFTRLAPLDTILG